MNDICLELKIYSNEMYLNVEGMKFKNIAHVIIKVDGIELLTENVLGLGFLVFDEFVKSSKKDGVFLIFTSVIGVADEGGWDYVHVKHKYNSISWNFERDGNNISYLFSKEEYINYCNKIQNQLKKINSDIKIEPSNVIFPE